MLLSYTSFHQQGTQFRRICLRYILNTVSPCSSNAENLPYQLCINQYSPLKEGITFCKFQLVKMTLYNEHIMISADWKMWSRVLRAS